LKSGRIQINQEQYFIMQETKSDQPDLEPTTADDTTLRSVSSTANISHPEKSHEIETTTVVNADFYPVPDTTTLSEEYPEATAITPDDPTLHSTPTVVAIPKNAGNADGDPPTKKLAEMPDTPPLEQDTQKSSTGTKKSKKEKKIQSAETKPTTPLPYRRRRAGLPIPLAILVVTLVVLLIVSGFGLIILAETTQYRATLRAATTTARQATQHADQTTQAQQRGTSESLGTAQANIEASATAQTDEQNQATATVEDTTATAEALNTFYMDSTNSNPIFDDPLSDSTGPGKWDEGSVDANTGCEFGDDGYHAREAQNGNFQPCIAQAKRFSSFAYQVHVTIQKGSQGRAGLLFRIGNDSQSYYFFSIGADGSYALDLYTGENQGQSLTLGTSSAILTGLDEDNLITAIASSTSLFLYANGEYLTQVSDSKLSAGKIGLGVVSKNGPVEAIFHDAQLWQLAGQQQPDYSTPDYETPGYYETPTATATETSTTTP
jgi:type II secretory pathway pseudopilin PulG